MSLTSLTISGLLPPISKANILPGCPPNCSCKKCPVAELPVKNNPSIILLLASALPVSISPCTRLITPAGRPASCQIFNTSSATLGVNSLGLNTMVLPAISAGTIWPLGKCPGKLYGPNTATTPWGL